MQTTNNINEDKKTQAKPSKIKALANVKNIIAVAAGKGGVGKSTVALNLAFSLKKNGFKVGLLDADVYGPSIPTMIANVPKKAHTITQENTIVPMIADEIKVISLGHLSGDTAKAAILRGPMAGNVVKQFLTQVEWGELDYLIIDYPPGTGDIQLTISQTASITGAVIVTTPQEVSLVDVRKAINMFQTVKVPLLGLIETMSYFQPPESDKKYYIFGKQGGENLCDQYGIRFLGAVPIEEEIASCGDQGKPLVLTYPDSISTAVFQKAATLLDEQTTLIHENEATQMGSFSMNWKN